MGKNPVSLLVGKLPHTNKGPHLRLAKNVRCSIPLQVGETSHNIEHAHTLETRRGVI